MTSLEIMHDLLETMYQGEVVYFSDFGKKELDRIYELQNQSDGIRFSTLNWTVLSINCDNTVKICSDNHHIYNSAPLEWFNFN